MKNKTCHKKLEKILIDFDKFILTIPIEDYNNMSFFELVVAYQKSIKDKKKRS